MDDVRRAEEALVGAAVLAPERLDEVAGWLHPADFGSPACRLLFGRLLDVQRSGVELSGTSLLEMLRERGELRSDGYPVSALTRWFDNVPANPHVGAYGALVLEGALARQVEAAGIRLVQASARLGPGRALVAAVTQRSLLGAAQRRWRSVPTAVRATRTADREVARTSTNRRPARSARRSEDAEHAELVTVGSLLVAPQFAARVRWLEPQDFSSADLARAFSVLQAMTAAGAAVDPVTVGAELHHRGAAPSTGGWPALLGRAEAAVPVAGSVGFYGRQVLDAAVAGEVAGTGRRLVALGRSRCGGAPVMLQAALADLDGLREVNQRLRRSRSVTTVRPVRTLERTAVGRVAEPHALDRSMG